MHATRRQFAVLGIVVLVLGSSIGVATAATRPGSAPGAIPSESIRATTSESTQRTASKPTVTSATESNGTIEIAFSDPVVDDDGTNLEAADFVVWIKQSGTDGFERYDESAFSVAFDAQPASRVTISPNGSWGDLDPVDEVRVELVTSVRNGTTQSAASETTIGNTTVATASLEIDERERAYSSLSTALQVSRGAAIAFRADSEDEGLFLRNVETGEIILDGATGRNSRSIVFETDDLRAGATYVLVFDGATDADEGDARYFNVTSLDLSASLAQTTRIVEDRGDVVEIPIQLQRSRPGAKATLSIGSRAVDYVTNLTVVDENGDGSVVVEWNTYVAGVNDLDRIFDVQGPDTIAGWDGEHGAFARTLADRMGSNNLTVADERTLGPGQYELQVVANGGDAPATLRSLDSVAVDDAATVSLSSNAVSTTRVWVAPPNRSGTIDRAFIYDALDRNDDPVDGALTDSETVTSDEIVVQQIDASGLEGVLENRTDGGLSTDLALLSETREFLTANASFDGDPVWTVGYHEDASGLDRPPRQLALNDSTVDVVADPTNDTYFLVVDLGRVDDATLVNGSTYWANFSIVDGHSLAPTGDGVSDRWGFVARSSDPFDGAPARYNVDGNAVIEIGELAAAAADFAEGKIGIDTLARVAAAFAQSAG